MIKKFKDFFKKKNTDNNLVNYSQKEIDDNLLKSIKYEDYNAFDKMLKLGANVNQVVDDGSGRNFTTTPLLQCIFAMINEDLRYKFICKLIDYNVDLFGNIAYTPRGPYEVDIYEILSDKILSYHTKNDEILKYILQERPNFLQERDIRQNINKYNL